MKLYIGNQNYSSWSLRAWVCVKTLGLSAEVIKLPLFTEQFYQTLAEVSPAAKVPVWVDEQVSVWDSLAICEYLSEHYADGAGWPSAVAERAKARAIASEMHSGFAALRGEMPMNCRAKRQINLSAEAKADIARIDQIWAEQQQAYPQGWLFGDWSISDAMFAPVVLRFVTYGVALSPLAQAYADKTLASDAIKQWLAEAALETDIVKEDEAGESAE